MEFPVIVDLVKRAILKDLDISRSFSGICIHDKDSEGYIYIEEREGDNGDMLKIETHNFGEIEVKLTEKQLHQWMCLMDEVKEFVINKATRYINSFFDNSKKEVSIDDLDDSEDN